MFEIFAHLHMVGVRVLLGAGAGQQKGELFILDEPVDLIEESWNFLYFVNDDGATPGAVSFPQQWW